MDLLDKYLNEGRMVLIPTKKLGTVNTETGEWKEGFSDNLYDNKGFANIWENLKSGKTFLTITGRKENKVGDVVTYKRERSSERVPWFDGKLIEQMALTKLKKSNYKKIDVYK